MCFRSSPCPSFLLHLCHVRDTQAERPLPINAASSLLAVPPVAEGNSGGGGGEGGTDAAPSTAGVPSMGSTPITFDTLSCSMRCSARDSSRARAAACAVRLAPHSMDALGIEAAPSFFGQPPIDVGDGSGGGGGMGAVGAMGSAVGMGGGGGGSSMGRPGGGAAVTNPGYLAPTGGPMRRVASSLGMRRSSSFFWTPSAHHDFEKAINALAARGAQITPEAIMGVLTPTRHVQAGDLKLSDVEKHLRKKVLVQRRVMQHLAPPGVTCADGSGSPPAAARRRRSPPSARRRRSPRAGREV